MKTSALKYFQEATGTIRAIQWRTSPRISYISNFRVKEWIKEGGKFRPNETALQAEGSAQSP